ncbi:MAG: ribosome assembly cofactor RimP [Mangrovibacterium sp.]|jgi:ribosome maturation factor RimP
MVDRNLIIQLTEEKLEKDQFIVEITVSQANQISILLDSDAGISIEDCVRISRHIESSLNREEEDFDLQVSSAGLGQPLKVYRQYLKNLDREMEVVLTTGEKLSGILKSAGETGFDLEITKNEKVEGQKKKQPVTHIQHISFGEAKTVKNIIKF